ncbi:MAG: LysM peptidoglycan-binding domain-containing protein [Planctomycetaceae bacterium]|nr:LysM peptidoglycan-binding domain-containing protein [Planctomycetaceae bacterium]
MADPFKPQSSQQLIREAKIGLSVVALLFTTLIYVGTLRMTGQRPILPFNQMVGLDNTDAVPPSLKKKIPNPKTAQSDLARPFQTHKDDRAKIDSLKIEPDKDMQFFRPLSPKTPATIQDKPKFEVKNKQPPFVAPPAKFKPSDRDNQRDSFTVPKLNGDLKNPKIEPRISIDSQFGTRNSDFAEANEKDISTQVEINLSNNRNLKTPVSVTRNTPRIPSFIDPSTKTTQQISPTPDFKTQAPVKTRNFLALTQFEVPTPERRTDEPSKEENSFKSIKSLDAVKPTPSNLVTPEFNLANELPSVDESPSLRTYTTKTGDTYWSISETIYQDGRYFRALFCHNQSNHPDYKLVAGLKLNTPAKRYLERRWPAECPPGSGTAPVTTGTRSAGNNAYYVTAKGETLFGIARQKLNQASRFAELYQLNQDTLGNDVQPDSPLRGGLKLILPK